MPTTHHCNGLRIALVLLSLLVGPQAIADDLLADLPGAWADTLLPIPQPDFGSLDEAARSDLIDARNKVIAALQGQAAADELAAAYGELGGLYQVHNVFRLADDGYTNAMRLAPEQFRWAYYSAWLAAVNGWDPIAVTRYEHARSLNPGYKALTLRLADVWLDLNQLEKAQAAYEETASMPGLEAASLYGLGQIARLRRDDGTAIDYFTRALELDPDATRVHYPLAQALRAVKRNEEAGSHLARRGDTPPVVKDPMIEELQALKSGANVHFNQAMKAIDEHDYPAAQAAFVKGLEREPDNDRARISYARTLYLTDNKAAARAALTTALESRPDNSLGLFLLGVLSEEEGDTARAVEYYQQVLKLEPAHAGAPFYLANHYTRQGDYERSASYYNKAIEADPRNSPAYMLYLGALLHTDATDQAIMEHLKAAVRQFPGHPVFRTLLIQWLATSRDAAAGDPQEALRLAQQLTEEQRIPPHLSVLALALAANGNFEQAAAIQEEVVTAAMWSMPGEADRLAAMLATYQEGKLPSAHDLIPWPLFQAPPFDGAGPFRDYPASNPY